MSKLYSIVLPLGILLGGYLLTGQTQSPKPAMASADLRCAFEHLSTVEIPKKPKAKETPKPTPAKSSVMSFCGELFPIENPEVEQKFQKALRQSTHHKSSAAHAIKTSQRYRSAFMSIIKKNGLPEDVFYIAVAESGLANLTSPKGAAGFWQFMPETARNYGLVVNEETDERLDPIKSTEAACRYLKVLHKRLKKWTLVAAAYNMGEGGLENKMKAQKTKDYFALDLNAETAQYVYRIMAAKSVVENPKKYGIRIKGAKVEAKTTEQIKAEFSPQTTAIFQSANTVANVE